jgi:hypothetical protein
MLGIIMKVSSFDLNTEKIAMSLTSTCLLSAKTLMLLSIPIDWESTPMKSISGIPQDLQKALKK